MRYSARFPELIEPLSRLPTDAIIDGEIITARGEEILPFADLQKRLDEKLSVMSCWQARRWSSSVGMFCMQAAKF